MGVIIHVCVCVCVCVCEVEENLEGTATKESYMKSSGVNTINIDFLIRQTQHWNTVRSFNYFSTTIFCRSTRPPLGRTLKSVVQK